ncbi:MAG: SGNH/GDSL hydrolase family protein [Candidatus Omnitrophica bacterium]|nr:SGNH/GDSL hydrolase family protein [Candidatus Omnitrophota bacterium]
MFIGDSWTQGFDAVAEKRSGYADLTIQKLQKIFPDKNIQGYNFAWSSTNSSQAIHQFLDHYHDVRPRILIVMTGFNDFWNRQDMMTAARRISNEIVIDTYSGGGFKECIINNLEKSRVIKLVRLTRYNLFYKPKEMKMHYGANPYSVTSEYAQGFLNTASKSKFNFEERKEYLLKNYKEGVTDYNEFYSLMLQAFGGDQEGMHRYLIDKNMFKPYLITKDIDVRVYKDRALRLKITEQNLTDLKLLCDQNGIIIIIMNYPHLDRIYLDTNARLGKIAQKINAIYVDCFGYFKENITPDEWKEVMVSGHVNYKGHEYISNKLTSTLSTIINSELRRKEN